MILAGDIDEVSLILNWGGLGDQIARIPAVTALLNEHPTLSVNLFVYPYCLSLFQEVFSTHPRVNSIRPIDEWKTLPEGSNYISFDETNHLSLGMHITDHAYLTFCKRLPTEKYNYPTLRKAINNEIRYVALTPNFTAESRALPVSTWNQIIEYVTSLGAVPVLLGSEDLGGRGFSFSTDKVLDLRGSTTLQDALDWIQRARVVVGLDNGLIHLAGLTETPIIAMYSTQKAYNRAPRRKNGKIYTFDAKSACNGCEIKLRFMKNHDFKGCAIRTFDCVNSFSLEDIKEVLTLEILKNE